MKKIVIAGGTGFIGDYLKKRFRRSGYQVLIVSREKNHVAWNFTELVAAFENAELIINLAGKSINCIHDAQNKQDILSSRISTTKAIGDAILACQNPPKLWLNASATGIYRPSYKRPMSETETLLGSDFLAEVVTQWENTFFSYKLPHTRQIALRTSVVLGKNGGALEPLVKLTRYKLGGRQGDGNQFISWIHVEDYFRIVLFLMDNEALTGVVNCTAPQPVTNNHFMYTLRQKLHVKFGLPAPTFFIRIGAKLMKTEASLLLNSSYVIPKRLTDAGFHFHYSILDLALIDLLRTS